MCDECYGIYPCPMCGTDQEPDYEQELDDLLNEADDYNQLKKDEGQDED